MPSYNLLDLTTLVRAIGRASVFYAAGAFDFDEYGVDLALTHLGDTEGDIEIAANETYSDLKIPELTGEGIHERFVTGENPQVTIPIYCADAALRAIVSPSGSASGGHFRQRRVTEYTLALIPEELFIESDAQVALAYTQAGGWTVGGDAATTAQLNLLDLSVWFWRGHFTKSMPMYRHGDGGKVVQSITFQAMYNLSMPDGDALYTVGRPDQRAVPIYVAAA